MINRISRRKKTIKKFLLKSPTVSTFNLSNNVVTIKVEVKIRMMNAGKENQEDSRLILFAAGFTVISGHVKLVCMEISNEIWSSSVEAHDRVWNITGNLSEHVSVLVTFLAILKALIRSV